MANVVIVGMQWGDEGKGKIVDLLCPAFEIVARFQGGHNAGHTVRFGDRHFALHLIPSGILHSGTMCVMGNGMVILPSAFLSELDGLRNMGVETEGNLFVSDRAHLLLPAHIALDQAREAALGDNRIGTTSRGIGPAYEMKVSRAGLRMCDLEAEDLAERLSVQLRRIEGEVTDWSDKSSSSLVHETLTRLGEFRERLAPYLSNTVAQLNRWIDDGKNVLFEGAQGALLDVDHGTYPFVTSSNSTAGGACIGTGVAPTRIDGVLGILKAYTTRVGGGPFPTELDSGPGEYLRQRGNEFGTTTGRPRRCGWLDLVAARYARQLNGVEVIALTKLDVLDSLEEIPICVGYRLGGDVVKELPPTAGAVERSQPVLKTMKGWQQETRGILEFEDLPAAARDYIRMIEQEVEATVAVISTGPRREETVVCQDPTLERFLSGRLEAVREQQAAGLSS